MARNPFLFIVGCSRSGTTLLQHMVDMHPQIAVIPETRWFASWYDKRDTEKQYGVTPGGFATPEVVSNLLQRHRLFRDIDVGIRPEELYALVGSGPGIPWSDLVTFIFERYGHARGKPLVGNKTPGYVRRLPTLHTLWPRAKFVHIIRDGRDVYLSVMNWKGGKAPKQFLAPSWSQDAVMTAALWWEWDVRLGRETGRMLGHDLHYEIRYEALVRDPDMECAALCQFLGVPYDDRMLRHHEGRVRENPGVATKHSRVLLPVTSGLRDWRNDMSPQDIERFEAVAGELLDELDLPRGVQKLSPECLERAARLRTLFAGRPLPQRWQATTPAPECLPA